MAQGHHRQTSQVSLKLSTRDVVASYIYHRCKDVGLLPEELSSINFFDVGNTRPCDIIRSFGRLAMKKPMYENVQILLHEAYCLLKGNATPELKNRFYKFIQHYIFPEGSDPDWNKVMLLLFVSGEICEGIVSQQDLQTDRLVFVVQSTIDFLRDSFVNTAFIGIKGGWENIHIAHKYYSENPVDGNGDGQGQIKVISQPIAPWDEYDISTKLEEALSYNNESY